MASVRNCGIWNVLFFWFQEPTSQWTSARAARALTRGCVGVGSSCGLRLVVDITSLPPGILYHLMGWRFVPWSKTSGKTPRKLNTSRVLGWLRSVVRQVGHINYVSSTYLYA